jgi:hypothetical protein
MGCANLLTYRKNKYSQAGQDGIIEHIFNVLKINEGYFVEFGAGDGIHLSNCRKLFEEGWSGVFIEPDKERFPKLQKNYETTKQVTCLSKRVAIKGVNSFDNIMSQFAPEKPITFLSIDVDGIDLEIFESIEKYLPIVACIEGGQGPHPFDPRMPIHCIEDVGQSISVIDKVAKKKGYEIICSFQDQFLIKKDLLCNFDAPTDLFQLYLNGLQTQLYHIPVFAVRLKRLHRENKIFNYILEKTNYKNYCEDNRWLEERKQEIFDILNSLPNFLRNTQTKSYVIPLLYVLNLRKITTLS